MATTVVEKRKHQRTTLFYVPNETELVPVWFVKPDVDDASITGIVVDVSSSGLRVISEPHDHQPGQRFEVQFIGLIRIAGEQLPAPCAELVRVSHDNAHFLRNGLRLEVESDELHELITSISGEKDRYVRCLMTPIA